MIFQSITLQIQEDGTYSLDFRGGSVSTAYRVFRHIIENMESGDFFTHELTVTDEYGNTQSRDEIIRTITRIKEELDRDSGKETSVSKISYSDYSN